MSVESRQLHAFQAPKGFAESKFIDLPVVDRTSHRIGVASHGPLETELQQRVNSDILGDLIKVGILKAQGVPRTDASIRDLNRKTTNDVAAIIEENKGRPLGDTVTTYNHLLGEYMDCVSTLDPLRKFVATTFNPVFNGREQFVHDIQIHGSGLLIGTHNEHTPEIDVMDWENATVIHDVAPVITRIAMDAALEDDAIVVTRLTKSPRPSDFYRQVMGDLGNVILSEGGVDQIAEQMRAVVQSGEVPALSPEGGFRVLEKWSTGPIVLAVKSGMDHLHLVAHSPLVTLLDPNISFDYIGMREIPKEVQVAVEQGHKEPILTFSNAIRSQMATAIQDLSYPKAYKDHVAKFTTKA